MKYDIISSHPKYIEYLKTQFISFCETTERCPTLLVKILSQAIWTHNLSM